MNIPDIYIVVKSGGRELPDELLAYFFDEDDAQRYKEGYEHYNKGAYCAIETVKYAGGEFRGE